MRGGLATVTLTVLLAACSHLTSGEVIDKRHEDTRIYWESVPVYMSVPVTNCYGTGSSRSCSTTYQQRLTGYSNEQRVDDEDWVLILQNGEDRGEVEVSRDTFDRMEVGSWYGEPEREGDN